jgi:triacylglycerol lipase
MCPSISDATFRSAAFTTLFLAACSNASSPQTSSGASAGCGSSGGAGIDASTEDATSGAGVDASMINGSDASSMSSIDANSSSGGDAGPSGTFAQDPIVFVHGYEGSASNWSTAIPFFMAAGYPANYLRAISFTDSTGSNIPNAMELQTFVDGVLADLHVTKVDIIAHSMGGISARYYIKFLGGKDKVRDMVTLAGVDHGNNEACLFTDQASKEMCPAYPSDLTTVVGMINGLTGSGGDDTPFGVEDPGGSIYYDALWSNLDLVVSPGESECLFLTKQTTTESDCDTTHNTEYKNRGHNNFTTDTDILTKAMSLVELHNPSNP